MLHGNAGEIYRSLISRISDRKRVDTNLNLDSGYWIDPLVAASNWGTYAAARYLGIVFVSKPSVRMTDIYSTNAFGRKTYVGRLRSPGQGGIVIANTNPVYRDGGVNSLAVDHSFQPYAAAIITTVDDLEHVHVGGVLHFKQSAEGIFCRENIFGTPDVIQRLRFSLTIAQGMELKFRKV